MTPELHDIACTMHIPNLQKVFDVDRHRWVERNSYARDIAKLGGGFGLVDKVFQLKPTESGYGANIRFLTPQCRKAAENNIKWKYKSQTEYFFSSEYCSSNFETLKPIHTTAMHRASNLSLIFSVTREPG